MIRSTVAITAAFLCTTGVVAAGVSPAHADHIREGDVRFKTTCEFDRSLEDDPIVMPDQPGAAHLHNFFGRRNVDAFTTTFDDLVGGEEPTTCNDIDDRAAYWTPALVMSNGRTMEPSRLTAYYRRGEKHGTIEPYPAGLKVVAGWQAGKPQPSADIAGWKCGDQPSSTTPPASCGSDHLSMVVRFPDCWDGVNLDSADHRSHMAYSAPDPKVGANVCPPSHPVPLPQLTNFVNFDEVDRPSKVAGLSSGDTNTVHGDFFNGWDPGRLQERVDTCLNELQRCESGGDTSPSRSR